MSPLRDQLARLFLEQPPADTSGEEPGEAGVRWLPPGRAAVSALAAGDAAAARRPPALIPALRAPAIAIVCSPRDARVAGGAAGLALAQVARAGCAVVAEWTGNDGLPGPDRPAAPAARRVAAALRAAGHAVFATGRLVRMALPAGEDDAAARARAAFSAVVAPSVLAVAGPRGFALGGLLARCDLVVLAVRPDADGELTAMAVAEFERMGAAAVAVELRSSPGAAALARSGTALAAPLRAPFLAAVGARR